MEAAPSLEDLCQELKTIHVLELVKDEIDALQLQGIATEQLKLNGIKIGSIKRSESRAKSRTPGTPSPNVLGAAQSNVVEAKLKSHNVTVMVPKFLKVMCTFIQNHLDTEGIFRVGGACQRINALTNTMNDVEIEMMDPGISVCDVCSAMKKLIQKMEEPLIPTNLHYVFLRCLELPPEQRSEAMLLAVLLLPKAHLHMLFYLMEFLHEVTRHSEKNKMNSKNLAIVFAPNIMVVSSIAVPTKRSGKDSLASYSKDLFHNVEIVEILIEAGDKLGVASNNVARALVAALALCKNSEDELESDGEVRKKKPRSASLNRLKEFWRKKPVVKNTETPMEGSLRNSTPGMNTPVIMSHSRKRSSAAAATPLSISAKNKIMSVIQKKRFLVPSTPTGRVAYPSPAVCLNPRPEVKESAGSTQAKGRMGRSLHRSNGSRSLPESSCVGEQDRAKTIVPIVPLANSPRKSLPRQKSPPTATPNSKPLASHGMSEPTLQTDALRTPLEAQPPETLRFTPMLREINELTLAALAESPVPSELLETPMEVESVPMLMEIGNAIQKLPNVQSGVPKSGMSGDNRRITRSKSRAEARRCQSFNDVVRTRHRRTSRRGKSDVTGMVLRSKTLSTIASPISASPRKNAQSLITLNRSPTRCTLRRGRPNTMKTGLPRPSPQSASTQPELSSIPNVEENPANIIIDRKGRVSQRVYKRPSLLAPQTVPYFPLNETVEKSKKTEQKIVKPPRTNLKFTSKLQSPKKVGMNPVPESSVPTSTHPGPSVASKLKKEGQTTRIILNSTPASTPTTPFSNRKGRSYSMRSDMIRPSPNNKVNNNLPYNSLLRAGNTCENPGTKLGGTNPERPMRRGLSVQELVRKFDSCNDVPTTKPTFATLRRDSKIGRLPVPDLSTRNRIVPGAIPPPKPPRTSFAENGNTTTGKLSSKQTQFNMLTRSASSTTNISRGSKQVLKTMNLP